MEKLIGKPPKRSCVEPVRIDEDAKKTIARLCAMTTPQAPRGFKRLTIASRALGLGLPLLEREIKQQQNG